jgi:uncharacterized protein involved in exopolysaccharide biosynthesis
MAQERAAFAPTEPAPLSTALRRLTPSREVISTQSRLETVRRTISDLEQFRNRRLAELQALLADQRNTYGSAHPQIENTQQAIRSLGTDSPQLVQLRRDEQELRGTLSRLGVDPSAPPTAVGPDPLLAAAALRTLDRVRADSLMGDRQQYARSRLKIAIRSYEELLERLDAARIELQTARAAFKFKYGVLVPPQVPSGPVKPKPVVVLVGGFLLAVCVALFVAVALDVVSGRVQSVWQIERSLGLPVLGETPNA